MQMAWNENQIYLVGQAAEAPVFSHENHAVNYYQFPLRVDRLSGTADTLNIVAAQSKLEAFPVAPGDLVAVEGEVRSYNNRSGKGNRLVITVYARSLARGEGPHCNRLVLSGVLCKPPVARRTPLGREICDLMLAVNRRYGRADYLPCIAWGSLAAWCSERSVGDGLKLEGRLQSRMYIKEENGQSTQRTAFEVSVMGLESAGGEDP